jgi:GTPase
MMGWKSILKSKKEGVSHSPLADQLEEVKIFKRAVLIGVFQKSTDRENCVVSLDELERLAQTYGLTTLQKLSCQVRKISAGTILAEGKLEEISLLLTEGGVDLVIFDDEISPQQQRNLEKLWKRAVIDRTELILEVFAQRAQTREARLQIELAQVKYQMPRLKRLWTHLSRQVGGGSHLKGEGEKQIELDKRLLRQRAHRLQKELKEVIVRSAQQRSARLRGGIPIFAIVGYTNVGKSSLLRALTQANVLVEDKLFATLDTTTRRYELPNKQPVLLVDTVGFIRKIPHTLVAAFKSTLEEAVHTDILIHLIDVSSPWALQQAEVTLQVLKELGATDQPMITVLNKIDLCENRQMVSRLRIQYPKMVTISATQGTGFKELLQLMMEQIEALRKKVHLRIPQSHYALVSEIMRDGKVFSLEYEENDILIKVEIPSSLEQRVARFAVEN